MFLTDEITGAPDNGWTALGMIGGAAAAAFVYGVVKLIKWWRTSQPQVETIAGRQYDVSGMVPELVRMLSDALETNQGHERRIADLEQTRGLLVVEIVSLRKGVEDGTIPPLHALDPRIAHLFDPPFA